jgi:seryl-tRNA synthetase
MLSIQFMREHSDEVRRALLRRNMEAPLAEALAVDAEWRRVLTEVEGLRAERNAISKEIGELSRLAKTSETKEAKHAEHRRSDLVARGSYLGDRLQAMEAQVRELEGRLRALMLEIPNIPAGDVLEGPDEGGNVVVRESGEPQTFDFEAKPHWDIGEALDIIDLERGAKLSGARFVVLKGAAARLSRALIAWMLDFHIGHGYREVYPPAMLREENMWAGGWLPKFAEYMFHDAEEDYWLLPTAEVALTNMHRDEVFEPGALPVKYVAYSPCFRREKVAAGRDVRGMKRVRQFDKVEIYQFVEPGESNAALDEMVAAGETLSRALEIPHRVVEICTGDLGFNASKSFDLEMWAPGSGEWLEVASASNCTDFQARRANIRFRGEQGGKLEHPHTLNASGLAIPRVLIAVLESYQQADGSVIVPEVLRPYSGGLDRITPAAKP